MYWLEFCSFCRHVNKSLVLICNCIFGVQIIRVHEEKTKMQLNVDASRSFLINALNFENILYFCPQ